MGDADRVLEDEGPASAIKSLSRPLRVGSWTWLGKVAVCASARITSTVSSASKRLITAQETRLVILNHNRTRRASVHIPRRRATEKALVVHGEEKG